MIGPDVMEHDTTLNIFEKCLTLSKNLEKEIGIVLMDQIVISGIGNYLRSEILYLSKINPFRKVKLLSKLDIKKIYKYTKMLTWGQYNRTKAIQYGYMDNKTKLAIDHQQIFFVYKQDKDIYGNKVVIKELYQGSQKRFIYYVPSIQK
jgi:formamidopyrimidine-DNA glycosylase